MEVEWNELLCVLELGSVWLGCVCVLGVCWWVGVESCVKGYPQDKKKTPEKKKNEQKTKRENNANRAGFYTAKNGG